jgi:hypothetical protein
MLLLFNGGVAKRRRYSARQVPGELGRDVDNPK